MEAFGNVTSPTKQTFGIRDILQRDRTFGIRDVLRGGENYAGSMADLEKYKSAETD